MKRNELLITVAGPSNSGKSTVVQTIMRVLSEQGFNVNFKFANGINENPISDVQEHRVRSLIEKKTKITIEEQPVRADRE